MRASQQKKTLSTEKFTVEEWDPESLTNRNWTPEQYLQAEVLSQAWDDLKTPAYPSSPRARRLVRESIEWVEGHDEQWVFSSGPICDSLGININALRDAFRKVKAKRDTLLPQEQPAHIPLIDKLLAQMPRPETFTCASREEAFGKRNVLIASVVRLFDDPQKYRLRTRVVDSCVICWIEEGPRRCLYCDMIVALDRRVCRFHRREAKRRSQEREKQMKKENV